MLYYHLGFFPLNWYVLNCVQHIKHLPHAACRLPCGSLQRDSSAVGFDRAEIASVLALSYWLKPLTMEVGRKLEYLEKIPDDKLQKMPHTKP